MTEQDLANHIIKWLEEKSWTIYQEVCSGALNPIADIVAVKNGLTWIIECKKSYGIAVLDQACFWLGRFSANYISVAVLRAKRKKSSAAWFFHRNLGIGLMNTDANGYVTVNYEPKLIRTKKNAGWNIKNMLREEHKHYAEAGGKGGGYFTPFRKTSRDIVEHVKKNPGTTIKEMIDDVGKCHWVSDQTAKSCIAKYIREDIIKGIVVRQDGRKHRLYLVETESK